MIEELPENGADESLRRPVLSGVCYSTFILALMQRHARYIDLEFRWDCDDALAQVPLY